MDMQRQIVDRLMIENPDKVKQMRERPALIGWFVGQAMKATQGTGDPVRLCELIAERTPAS